MSYSGDPHAYRQRLEARLAPGRIKSTLAFAGLYQLTHEMLKSSDLDDAAEASQPGPGGYVRDSWGFWFPYFASEVTLGVLAASEVPRPGSRSAPGMCCLSAVPRHATAPGGG